MGRESRHPVIPFNRVWAYTDSIAGSFTKLSAEKLYEVALSCRGTMVEVGVSQGRSASVLLVAAEQTGSYVVLVDSWESVLVGNMPQVDSLLNDFPKVRVSIVRATSIDAATMVTGELGLVHIDADHYRDSPSQDCRAWLPKLRSGGVACFHDYESSFPAVTEAVNEYTAGWESLGNWDGLAIRRKP